MSEPWSIEADSTRPLEFEIAGESPHVFSYRFWYRLPAEKRWTKFAEGHTGVALPDRFTVGPLVPNSEVSYWIGVGGHGNSAYRVHISVRQDGTEVPGGVFRHDGTTTGEGGAVVQNQLLLG